MEIDLERNIGINVQYSEYTIDETEGANVLFARHFRTAQLGLWVFMCIVAWLI